MTAGTSVATRRVYLHGSLRRFGKTFDLAITSPADAVRALALQIPGFRAALRDGYYRVVTGAPKRRRARSEDELTAGFSGALHIIPVISGAHGGKWLGIGAAIAGAALLSLAFGVPLLAGWAFGSTTILGVQASTIALFGGTLGLYGLTHILAPKPKLDGGLTSPSDERMESFLFGGAPERPIAGRPVPVNFGTTRVKCIPISTRIKNIRLGLPGGPAPDTNPANTLQSRAVAEILAVIGEGPIVPPADDLLKQIYLGGVPIKSSDGTVNFKNVSATIALGYPDQAYTPGIAAAETVYSIATEVTYSTPIVRAVSDTTATGARVAITIPTLVSIDSSTGARNPSSVSISIDVQPNGGAYSTVVTDTISGKCISPYQTDYEVPLAGTGPWNIRVTRITPDSTSDLLSNETHWASLSVLRDYRLAYPDTALLHLSVDAEQLSGSFPTIEYQGNFLILEVPTNYDPVARTFSGVWDGTFKTALTDDPAWVLWAVKTNDRWGLGRWIDLSAVDRWSLYDASVWFNELVADGKGGLEPRYAFNGTIDSVVKAYDAVTILTGACQGMSYWSSGSIHTVIDKPGDPIKQIGPANVVGGKLIYSGSDRATRPTAVHVTWSDPQNGYDRAVEAVEDPDLIALHGLRIKEVAAVLCKSQGQANRIGRYEYETAWSETQSVTFAAGQDHHDISPGDLIDVADPSIQGIRMVGRLLAVDGTTITLDAAVTIESGQTYDLRIVDTTGALQTRSVVMSPGAYSTVIVSSVFSPAPIIGAMWQLIASNLAPRRFRAIVIDENQEKNTYAILAVQHDPNKQARIEGGVVLGLPPVTSYGGAPLDAPSDLVIDEVIERLPSGTYRHRVTLGWAKQTDPRVVNYEAQYKPSNVGFWTSAGYTNGTTAEIDELGSGPFDFQVRAIGFDGGTSPWAATLSESLTGLDAPPPDVSDLTIAVLDANALLSWSTVSIANLDHYEVRFAEDAGANWQSMVPIAPRVAGTSVQAAARTGIYAVKAVTAQGVESENAAVVSSDISGQTINVVETSSANPTWSGTKVQCEYEGARNALKLSIESGSVVYESGTYTWPSYIDLGEIFTSRVTAALAAFGESTVADVWSEPDIYALANVWGEEPTGWDVYMEVKTTEDDPAGSPTWTEWKKLVASDLRFRAIWPRLILKRGIETVRPIVTEATIVVDMPDRLDAQGPISVSISGTRVSYLAAFRGPTVPSVVITGIGGGASGDWPDVSNIDTTGFDITIRNSGGTAQSGRSIHYHAFGYGKVLT